VDMMENIEHQISFSGEFSQRRVSEKGRDWRRIDFKHDAAAYLCECQSALVYDEVFRHSHDRSMARPLPNI
jgi:hypothetical protein